MPYVPVRKTAVDDELLTVDDIARALKVSKWSVRKEIEDGQLSALRIRNRLRIEPKEFERYLAAIRSLLT